LDTFWTKVFFTTFILKFGMPALLLIFTNKNMRYLLFLCLLMVTQACTRTSQNGQQTEPTPVPKVEKPAEVNFGAFIFKATGNEPSWLLQIDDQQQLSFKSIDDHQLNLSSAISEVTRMSDGDAIRLQTNTEGKFNVTLLPGNCNDNMSGKKFGQTVQVMVQTPEMEQPVLYKGCGMYKGAYQVNQKWMLTSIDGTALPKTEKSNMPYLTIQLLEGKMYSYSGCNYLNGTVNMKGERLIFGPVAATKKACRNNNIETAMIQTLSSKAQKFAINEKKQELIMKSEAHTLIFKAEK